ncbi:glycerophosphodiester phosphodiesterase family protein [Schaalia suimastitidis]|uniref:glycerophosphodiester phosphodiesterase family protein n=1 Tax=Schaalia suimastitidis TaxID=121163 RepID=UPI00041B4464|nr:glycerophosphodiester phosphodiesterase family protein [Schaalia suimastitidis]
MPPKSDVQHEPLPVAIPWLIRGGTPSDLWLYIRYHLLSKLLLSLVVFPLFRFLAHGLILLSGRTSISSGDFKGFLFSPYGFIIIVLSLFLLTVMLVTDIVAFVIVEMRRMCGEALPSARTLLWMALRHVPRFFHPGTLVFVLVPSLFVPLAGFGPSLAGLSWLKIPAFVQHVIFDNTWYSLAYGFVVLVCVVVTFFLLQTVPAMLVLDLNPLQAMRMSARFTRRHWRHQLRSVLRSFLSLAVSVICVFGPVALLTVIGTQWASSSLFASRMSAIAVTLSASAAMAVIIFLSAPLRLRGSTRYFAQSEGGQEFTRRDIALVRREDRKAWPRLIGAFTSGIVALIGLSAFGAYAFDVLFPHSGPIAVVAHRGGGNLDAENSVEGVVAAANAGAAWTEIDVQRTADGYYIVNHDETFQRLAGDSRRASKMTLEQIRALQVKNTFTAGAPSRHIATLDEVFEAARGRIGLYIELKGATADKQMVDDVAQMIRRNHMESQAVILSLDLDLIKYSEAHYPQLLSGYLFYFALGDITAIPADYLIMEEGLASEDRIFQVQSAGKRAVVWTVNSAESITRFSASSVDGIITDKPVEVLQALTQAKLRSDFERVVDALMTF